MVDFHEVRLPDDIERNARGGPAFKTSVSLLASGKEKRLRKWTQPLGSWDIGYGIQKWADIEDVIAFHYSKMGRGFGFRFKDWSDYTMLRQEIGIGDGAVTDFQLFKRYSDGTFFFDRTLEKIVSSPIQVWVNNVEFFDPADFSIDLNTGLITLVVAAPGSELVEAACEFDVPVRFREDELNINAQSFANGSIPKINLEIIRV